MWIGNDGKDWVVWAPSVSCWYSVSTSEVSKVLTWEINLWLGSILGLKIIEILNLIDNHIKVWDSIDLLLLVIKAEKVLELVDWAHMVDGGGDLIKNWEVSADKCLDVWSLVHQKLVEESKSSPAGHVSSNSDHDEGNDQRPFALQH